MIYNVFMQSFIFGRKLCQIIQDHGKTLSLPSLEMSTSLSSFQQRMNHLVWFLLVAEVQDPVTAMTSQP